MLESKLRMAGWNWTTRVLNSNFKQLTNEKLCLGDVDLSLVAILIFCWRKKRLKIRK